MTKQQTSVRAYGILVRSGRVLLVRSSSPQIAPPVWWLPGGGIGFAETPEETIQREFYEETGLIVGDPLLFDVASDVRRRPNGDRVHTVRVLYRVSLIGGELRDETSGTTDRAQWFELANLDEVNVADYARLAIQTALAK